MGDKERAKVCVRQSERVHRVAQGAGVTMSSLGEGFGKFRNEVVDTIQRHFLQQG